MRNAKEEALRWLNQAEHDLKALEILLKQGFFSDSCYFAEQICQKVLKAFLIAQGQRFVPQHSIKVLTESCRKLDKDFASFAEMGKVLDQYYLGSRYPDAVNPPALPFEIYTENQAREAADSARTILSLVRKKLVS